MVHFVAQRANAGQSTREASKCIRQLFAGATKVIDCNVRETGGDTRAERIFLFTEDVSKPVPALGEHFRQQPLNLSPAIVDALEQQLDIRCEHGVAFALHEHAASGATVKLFGRSATTSAPPAFEAMGNWLAEPGS